MPLLFWLIENTMAAAVGYYVGRYLSVQDRNEVRRKAIAAQQKAAKAAAAARELSAQAVEGEWEEVITDTDTVIEELQ